MKIKLPSDVNYIIGKLNANGYEAFAVGGCIRDSLMGKNPDDWDITTSAKPEQVARVFKGENLIPTGIKHGTVTLVLKKKLYEITTYRIDGEYLDGRRPENVSFTSQLKEDLTRRDFTINAMAYNDESGLRDYYSGVEDIREKRIKCVGNVEHRFSEDYLRMLRAYRFSAVLGFSLERDIINYCEKNKNRLLDISSERIRTEFEKALVHGNTDGVRDFLSMFGEIILGELYSSDNLDFTVNIIGKTKRDTVLRLFSLLYFLLNGKEESEKPLRIESALKNLKYDNKTISTVCSIARYYLYVSDYECVYLLRKLINKTGVDIASCIINIYGIAGNLHKSEKALALVEGIKNRKEACSVKELHIKGNDIMSAFDIPPSEKVGSILSRLMDIVLEYPEKNNYHSLIELASRFTSDPHGQEKE